MVADDPTSFEYDQLFRRVIAPLPSGHLRFSVLTQDACKARLRKFARSAISQGWPHSSLPDNRTG